MKKLFFAGMLFFLTLSLRAQIAEGIKHLENENYVAAVQAFETAAKADTKSGLAYFWLGEVAYVQEDFAAAEKSYKRGLEVGNCPECYVGLGKIFLDKGNTAEAEKNFELAKRMDKKKASTWAFIGDAYLYSKNPNVNKAIENLETAKGMDPSKAIYWAHLGDAYNMNKSSGEAMTAYETAIEKDPSNAEAYIKMSRIWNAAKRHDQAIDNLKKAIELSPNDARPIKDLYELYIAQRQYDKVVPLLEKYIQLAGTDVDAKVRLVKFLTFQAKDYERAIIEGEKLLKANVNDYTLHRWLAWSYVGQAKLMEADMAEGTFSDTAKIQSYFCSGLEQSKKLFDAIGKDSNRKAFPEDYDNWAMSTLRCGSLDEAAHIYKKYIELEPSRAIEINGTLAKMYYDSARYDQAVKYYMRKGEQKALSNVDEYYLGLSHYYQKNWIEADSSFAKVLRATPNYAQGYIYRARIGNNLDSTDTKQYLAFPHYSKFVEIVEADAAALSKNKKGLVESYSYLAFYEVQHNNNQKALEYYDKILAIEPDNSVAIENKKILKEQRR